MEIKTTIPEEIISQLADRVVEKLRPVIASAGKSEPDEIMGVPEVASYLGMAKKWVYDQTAAKTIPHMKFGNILKFRRNEIDKWLATLKIPAVKEPGSKLKLIRR